MGVLCKNGGNHEILAPHTLSIRVSHTTFEGCLYIYYMQAFHPCNLFGLKQLSQNLDYDRDPCWALLQVTYKVNLV